MPRSSTAAVKLTCRTGDEEVRRVKSAAARLTSAAPLLMLPAAPHLSHTALPLKCTAADDSPMRLPARAQLQDGRHRKFRVC